MKWWDTLGNIDKVQVISGISTAIAAIAALITTCQNHKSIKNQERERHAMLKPDFVVTSTSEDRISKEYKISIENIGYNILNSIVSNWEGTGDLDMKLDKYLEKDKTLSYVIKLKINESNNDGDDIKGKIMLSYLDVLGKRYDESINVVFDKIYNEVAEQYYLCLKNIYGENFI